MACSSVLSTTTTSSCAGVTTAVTLSPPVCGPVSTRTESRGMYREKWAMCQYESRISRAFSLVWNKNGASQYPTSGKHTLLSAGPMHVGPPPSSRSTFLHMFVWYTGVSSHAKVSFVLLQCIFLSELFFLFDVQGPFQPACCPLIQISDNVDRIFLSLLPGRSANLLLHGRFECGLGGQQRHVWMGCVHCRKILVVVQISAVPMKGNTIYKDSGGRVTQHRVDVVHHNVLLIVVDEQLHLRVICTHARAQKIAQKIACMRCVQSVAGVRCKELARNVRLVLHCHFGDVDALAGIGAQVFGEVQGIGAVHLVAFNQAGVVRVAHSLVSLHPRGRTPGRAHKMQRVISALLLLVFLMLWSVSQAFIPTQHSSSCGNLLLCALHQGNNELQVVTNAEVGHVEVAVLHAV
eukprot:m.140442 g.140442  ORF g.140442 m.140442 type:complete len:406 (+) comp20336_c0_seq1:128-1345(+)